MRILRPSSFLDALPLRARPPFPHSLRGFLMPRLYAVIVPPFSICSPPRPPGNIPTDLVPRFPQRPIDAYRKRRYVSFLLLPSFSARRPAPRYNVRHGISFFPPPFLPNRSSPFEIRVDCHAPSARCLFPAPIFPARSPRLLVSSPRCRPPKE